MGAHDEMGEPDYRGITDRVQQGDLTPTDRAHIMALLGYETQHGETGCAL